jgi:hypothetical protein
MTQLSDLNPSNTFEAQLLEVLKAGVPSSGVSEDFAKTVEAIVNKVIGLDARVAEIERKLQVITTAIKEEAGG